MKSQITNHEMHEASEAKSHETEVKVFFRVVSTRLRVISWFVRFA
jgi:hypothetical protein